MRRRGAVAAFATTAVAGAAISLHVAAGRPILERGWALLAELGVWTALWAAGVVLAFRLSHRRAVLLVIVAGAAVRVAALAGPPVTSDDLYRYAWDGRAQQAGFDSYAHVPASHVVAGLREPWLWPGPSECAALGRPAGCTRINRPGAPTIYPPAAEAWFGAVYGATGGVAHRYKPWQVAGLATELAVLALLPIALRRFGRDPRWTALYALSPAPALEIVNNGHVDGLAVLLIVAAFTVAGGRWRHRDLVAGALIGAAALVKLYPLVALVAVAGLVGLPKLRSLIRAGGAAVGVMALAYAPHVAAVGWRVLGYLPGYLHEEHYASGGRFLLAGAVGLTGAWAALVSIAAVGAFAVRGRQPAPARAAAVLGVLLLVASPVQPWYAVLLLAVATISGQPRWSAVVVAGYPYFFAVILDARATTAVGRLAYLVAAVAVVLAAAVSARPDGGEDDNDARRRVDAEEDDAAWVGA